VFQEGNQRGGNRHYLTWRHVHVVHLLGWLDGKLAHVPYGNQFLSQFTFLVYRCGRLGNHMSAFFNRRQVFNITGDLAVDYLAVRRFDKAVVVGTGIGGQGVDQADVRTFRGFDGTHTAIVGRVHVAHFKTGPLAGQTTWPQRRDAALVGDFRQRVVLIHKLGQLAGAEELFHGSGNRLGVDQVLGHQPFALHNRETFLDCTLDPDETNAELVFSHLAHRADAAVAEVVNVVHNAFAIANGNQGAHNVDNILTRRNLPLLHGQGGD